MRRSIVAVATVTLALMSPAVGAQAAVAPTAHLAVLAGDRGRPLPGRVPSPSGSVEVEFPSLLLVLAQNVGNSGYFRITLVPGKYTVIGCGPAAWTGPHGRCSSPKKPRYQYGEVRPYQAGFWRSVP